MNELTEPTSVSSRPRLRVDADRIFYSGRLGQISTRRIGALTVYVAPEGRLRFALGAGAWAEADCVVVQPYVPHRLASPGGRVCAYLIEPETVEPGDLPAFLCGERGSVQQPDLLRAMREFAQGAPLEEAEPDCALFGKPLPHRTLDSRIARVIAQLQIDPDPLVDAAAYARDAGLSSSRLLHLFKQEVGHSFRSLRAWKRARSLLPFVHQTWNLTHLALEIGYPDSTHFSHSIRQIYGLTPREILQGSRRLETVAVSARATSAAASR